MATTIDPARRAALNTMRLLALLDDARAAPTERRVVLGGGAGVLADDGTAWVLLAELGDRGPDRQLGAALAFAVRHEASSLHVGAEQGAGVLARRAGWFSVPIRVSRLEGRTLAAADPDPLPEPATARPEHRSLAGLITAGGALAVEEHGVVAGEVDGLEVCRVVDDPITGEVRLEWSVGAHDETFSCTVTGRPWTRSPTWCARWPGTESSEEAAQHPLNQLAASRRRARYLLADPTPVGAAAPGAGRSAAAHEPEGRGAVRGRRTRHRHARGVHQRCRPGCRALGGRCDRAARSGPVRDRRAGAAACSTCSAASPLLTVPTRFVGL
ncbi:MAG: hypothetical protein R2713_08895 [Ilumatobacteraceae bacterium]